VIDQLFLKDQEFIYEMSLKWKEIFSKNPSEARSRDIFIVHNHKTISNIEELDEMWKKICGLFPGNPSFEDGVPFFSTTGLNCRHVILANQNSECGVEHNGKTFRLLKKWISSIVKKDKKDISSLVVLKNAINSTITKYISGIEGVDFDENNSTFNVEVKNGMIPFLIASINPNIGQVSKFKPLSRTSNENDYFTIMVELPNVDLNTIEIEENMLISDKLNTWILIVSGIKNDIKMEIGELIYTDEFSYGEFEEKFYIPNTHILDNPKIVLDKGVLTIKIPKKKIPKNSGKKKLLSIIDNQNEEENILDNKSKENITYDESKCNIDN